MLIQSGFHVLSNHLCRLSYDGSKGSFQEDSAESDHVQVAGVSGRWPGSHSSAGVAGFWEAWRTQKDLPQVI